MSADNNTTITLLLPLPAPAKAAVQRFVATNSFARDWDEESPNLSELQPGAHSLYARNCSWFDREAIVKLARDHGFSIIVHCEDHADTEGECKSDVVAFECGTGRGIGFMATNNTHEPLLTIDDVFPPDPVRMKQKFLLPVDILQSEGERMPPWCKKLMEAAA